MVYDFRYRNASGKWESAGKQKGADSASAFTALAERSPGGKPPGRYMGRPRTRQKDWDLFTVDQQGNITPAD